MRPEASETTGMLRETSGLTVPVTFNSGARFVLARRGQGKLLGMIYAECAAILFLLDLRGRRRSGFRISLAAAAT